MTKPNEPTLTCSEVVERLAVEAHSSYAQFDREKATAILHSWRERRVQELEELLAKHTKDSRITNSASSGMEESMASETRKTEEGVKAESEFGKGLTYCIGLFLAHEERSKRYDGYDDGAELWFNGASDHCYELVIPESLPEELRARLDAWQSKCLHWGHGYEPPKATKSDREWALDEAKELLRLIDEAHGVSTIEASWK